MYKSALLFNQILAKTFKTFANQLDDFAVIATAIYCKLRCLGGGWFLWFLLAG